MDFPQPSLPFNLCERGSYRWGHEIGDVPAEFTQFTYERGGDVDKFGVRGEEHRFDPAQVLVHQRHRQFVVVIGAAADPLDDRARTDLAAEISDEPGHELHPRPGDVGDDLGHEVAACFVVDERCLRGIDPDRDDHLVRDPASAAHDVNVPEGDGIEGSWTYGNAGTHSSNVPDFRFWAGMDRREWRGAPFFFTF